MLGRLLRTELANYPGRASLALRMAVSCTAVMVIAMVFRIPGAALGAYIPMLLPREDFRSTWQAVSASMKGAVVGAMALLLGAVLFAGSPIAHFFWAMGSVLIVFFLISVITIPSAAVSVGLLVINGIAIWDRPVSTSQRVTLTLYMALSVLIGCAVTAAVEFVFAQTHPRDIVINGIRERLALVRQLLGVYITQTTPDSALQHQLSLYARRGTGHLHEILSESAYDEPYRSQMDTALSLSHELVELGCNLSQSAQYPSDADSARMTVIAARLLATDAYLGKGDALERVELPDALSVSPSMPSLGEMERNVDLVIDVFIDGIVFPSLSAPVRAPAKLFVDDIFRTNRHVRFAVRGALSAMLCYLVYMSAGWRGLEASIVTCVLTARTSIGMTRQRQFLRLAGVFVGGVILGIGSQALLLPHIDTIPELALLFGSAIFICSWVAASGPRIAFSGLQMALAYELVNLNGFAISTSLATTRDTLLGILLGLGAMWLIYDTLWATPSVVALRSIFAMNLRRIGKLGTTHLTREEGPEHFRVERIEIDRTFEDLSAYADSMLFEPSHGNNEEQAMVKRIRLWQTPLRSISLLQFGLLNQIAKNGTGSPLSAAAQRMTEERLLAMAHFLEGAGRDNFRREDFFPLLDAVERAQALARSNDGLAMELHLSHSLLVLAKDLDRRTG